MLLAFRNGRIFTGSQIERDRTLLVRDGRIESLVNAREVIGADEVIDLQGGLLVPGFIDTQVNGGGGVLFNDDPSVETIAAIARAQQSQTLSGIRPYASKAQTIISNKPA